MYKIAKKKKHIDKELERMETHSKKKQQQQPVPNLNLM